MTMILTMMALVWTINAFVKRGSQDGHVVRFQMSIQSFIHYYRMKIKITLWVRIWASISCFQPELWRQESSRRFCREGSLHDNIDSQRKCQNLCDHNGFTGCFGVAYFEMAMKCYVCNDYNIVPSNRPQDDGHAVDSNGFYRHPSNKELIFLRQFSKIFKNR